MAALHDGDKFLIEKYPISYSLSSNLVTPIVNNSGDPLIFGLSLSIADWRPLTAVIKETEQVKSLIGGETILNEDFTVEEFTKSIKEKQPSTVHIATHGKFVGVLERSYLQAFDGKITLSELERALSGSNKTDLLVLSACQTAAGNNKSVLGMAGIALRSGIPTIVGSLWSLPDLEAAELMKSFYTYLKRDVKPSEALREMQLEKVRMDNEHPSIWSSFIVIEN
jgi:CHAT domain-containing protein